MHDNEKDDRIGGPMPIEGGSVWETVGRFAGLAIAAAGGITIFAVLTTPTHTRGATASSKLRWQAVPPRQEPAQTTRAEVKTNAGICADTTLPK